MLEEKISERTLELKTNRDNLVVLAERLELATRLVAWGFGIGTSLRIDFFAMIHSATVWD